jgi:hypothetical protein
MFGKASNQGDSSYSILEDFVVQCNEKGPYILSLCKMFVEPLIEISKYDLSDFRI